jgi:DNA-binding XRE family transcriptional regulator
LPKSTIRPNIEQTEIEARRIRSSITRAELARESGVDEATIYRLETRQAVGRKATLIALIRGFLVLEAIGPKLRKRTPAKGRHYRRGPYNTKARERRNQQRQRESSP